MSPTPPPPATAPTPRAALLDPAGCEDCLLVPGSLQRVRRMQALRKVVRELSEIPTVLAYERHAAGRSELPSSATLRNRLGRWSSITTQLAAQSQLVRETRARSAGLAARSA